METEFVVVYKELDRKLNELESNYGSKKENKEIDYVLY